MRSLFAGLIVVVAACGCGDGGGPAIAPAPMDQPAPVTDNAELKKMLTDAAESGAIGSGVAGIRGGIQSFDKPDLIKLVDQLEQADQAGNSAKVKAIAKELAGKL
jgi:hypothetical protein